MLKFFLFDQSFLTKIIQRGETLFLTQLYKVKKVSFGDTTGLSIKRDDPARRKSFRARHNCDNPGPKTKARYWSCYQWRANAPVDN